MSTSLTLYNEWGSNIFQNISGAEQSHMDQVGDLLTQLGIADPIVDDTVGVFASTELMSLYTSLVAQGSLSQSDALLVGVRPAAK